jgi:hypothetical protein
LETIYDFYGEPANLSETHGAGSVRGTGPGNTHCNNIGPEHLVAIHAAFERWFRIPVPKREDLPRHTADELTCLTPAAAADRPMRPLHQIAKEIGARQATAARERLAKLSRADRRRELRRDWSRLLGDVEPGGEPQVNATLSALPGRLGSTPIATSIERLALEVEPGIVVPLVLLVPARAAADKRPVVVAVAQAGKNVLLEKREQAIADILAAGIAVCLPDLRGTGDTKPDDGRGRGSSADDRAVAELMLGQTALGARLRDLRSVLRYLRTRSELDGRRIALWGDSFADRNPRDKNLAVPLDAAESLPLAEPLGGLVVLLAALFEDDIRAVSARGGFAELQSLLESPFIYVPHDVIVPGALGAGDLCDVAAALAPCPLQLADLVDAQNRALTAEEAAVAFAPVNATYGAQTASTLLLMGSGADSPAQWLIDRIRE